jgi:hypothetical protein
MELLLGGFLALDGCEDRLVVFLSGEKLLFVFFGLGFELTLVSLFCV